MLTHERFAYLAEKYIDTVFRVAFSYLKSREDADDVTQEVFMKLYSVNTEFESEEHIRNWLIRVTINQCRRQFRSPWRRLENIDDYAATLSFEDDNDRELFRAVMGLEQKYRSVIFLYYLLHRLFDGGDRGYARCAGEHSEHKAAAREGKAEDGTDGGGA